MSGVCWGSVPGQNSGDERGITTSCIGRRSSSVCTSIKGAVLFSALTIILVKSRWMNCVCMCVHLVRHRQTNSLSNSNRICLWPPSVCSFPHKYTECAFIALQKLKTVSPLSWHGWLRAGSHTAPLQPTQRSILHWGSLSGQQPLLQLKSAQLKVLTLTIYCNHIVWAYNYSTTCLLIEIFLMGSKPVIVTMEAGTK